MKYPVKALLYTALLACAGLQAYPENSVIYHVAIAKTVDGLEQYDWQARWNYTTSKLNQIYGMVVTLGQQIAELDAQAAVQTDPETLESIARSRQDLWEKYGKFIVLLHALKSYAQEYAQDDWSKKTLPEIAAIASYPLKDISIDNTASN